MKKKEIKVKIDIEILDKAKEYNINLEECLSVAIMRQVNEIREVQRYKEFIRKLDEYAIIDIIKRLSKKEGKFTYAYRGSIIADAKELSIGKKRTIDILDSLEKKKIINQPIKDNYRMSNEGL